MRFVIDYKKFSLACANECIGLLEATKKAHMSSCVLHKIRQGKSVHVKTLGKLAKAVNVQPTDLLKEDNYEQS